MSEKDPVNRASKADKVALGVGAAVTIAFAAGLHIARKSGETLRRFTTGDGSKLAKEYWQVDYIKDGLPQTRFFHGTESAIRRRLKHLKGELQIIKKLSEAEAQKVTTENQAHVIEL